MDKALLIVFRVHILCSVGLLQIDLLQPGLCGENHLVPRQGLPGWCDVPVLWSQCHLCPHGDSHVVCWLQYNFSVGYHPYPSPRVVLHLLVGSHSVSLIGVTVGLLDVCQLVEHCLKRGMQPNVVAS